MAAKGAAGGFQIRQRPFFGGGAKGQEFPFFRPVLDDGVH